MSIPSCRHKGMLSREQAIALYATAAAILAVLHPDQLLMNGDTNTSFIEKSVSMIHILCIQVENEGGRKDLTYGILVILRSIVDAAEEMQKAGYSHASLYSNRIEEGCQSLMRIAMMSAGLSV
ncbi:MAG: hypothetical protein KA054_03820 [Candidatus Moranbacteria bacterium]|nr:hypothetical protein [Candidatus Moranbacteria bacterium]